MFPLKIIIAIKYPIVLEKGFSHPFFIFINITIVPKIKKNGMIVYKNILKNGCPEPSQIDLTFEKLDISWTIKVTIIYIKRTIPPLFFRVSSSGLLGPKNLFNIPYPIVNIIKIVNDQLNE